MLIFSFYFNKSNETSTLLLLSKETHYIQLFFVNYYKILVLKAQNMVALAFQPYAESEKQNKLFHHLKTEVTPEGFLL